MKMTWSVSLYKLYSLLLTRLYPSVSIITCLYITYYMMISLLAKFFKGQKMRLCLYFIDLRYVYKIKVIIVILVGLFFGKKYIVYLLFFGSFSLGPNIWSQQCSATYVKWQLVRYHCNVMLFSWCKNCIYYLPVYSKLSWHEWRKTTVNH